MIRSIDKKIDYGAQEGKEGLTHRNEISLAWPAQGFADGKQLEPHGHQNI